VDEKLKTLLLFGFTIGRFPVNLSKFLNAAVHVHQFMFINKKKSYFLNEANSAFYFFLIMANSAI